MQAQFYLLNISFRHDPDVSPSELEDSIKLLSGDIEYIRQHQDIIFKHESIYQEELMPGYQIQDLFSPEKHFPLSKDVKTFLRKIINHNKSTTWSNEEILELISMQETEDLCINKEVYGILALLQAPPELPIEYLIYNQRDWLSFHRYFIAKYPCTVTYLLSECQKCFPELFFHPLITQTLEALEGKWENFSQSIIHHLTKLNDVFPRYLLNREKYQRIVALREFSAECNIDATPQGNASDKIKMEFEFENNEGILKKICCEPHIKISKSDKIGDETYYFNRIYFHEGDVNIHKGKILVGHIGKHINFK